MWYRQVRSLMGEAGSKTINNIFRWRQFHVALFALLVKTTTIGHFRVTLCLCFKTSLHVKPFTWEWVWFPWKWPRRRNSFPYGWFRTKTHFDTEAKDNSEMAYWLSLKELTAFTSWKTSRWFWNTSAAVVGGVTFFFSSEVDATLEVHASLSLFVHAPFSSEVLAPKLLSMHLFTWLSSNMSELFVSSILVTSFGSCSFESNDVPRSSSSKYTL